MSSPSARITQGGARRSDTELERAEKDQVQIYLQHASENFQAIPDVLYANLIENAREYVSRMPSLFVDGYLSITSFLDPYSGAG